MGSTSVSVPPISGVCATFSFRTISMAVIIIPAAPGCPRCSIIMAADQMAQIDILMKRSSDRN